MPIICIDGALEVADALAGRTSLGPVHLVDLDHAEAAAAEQRADLIVVAAGRRPGEAVSRLAHHATVPLLVVRDPAPFVAWGHQRSPLRAVLGWDDTATTVAALGPLRALRQGGPVDVEIVHVYFPDEAARRYGTRITSLVDAAPELEGLLRRDIAHRLGVLSGRGEVTIAAARGLGHVGDHLLERADAAHADLIVVGTHHHGGLRRLSSVAERVFADATASVLLAPLRPDATVAVAPDFQTAVVATDGSAFANCAIAYAYRLVPDHGEVHLVRVVAEGEQVDDDALVAGLLRLRPPDRVATRTVAHVVRDGDPAHAIAVAAERVGADVVCIASHVRAGIVRVVLGSVTDRLLHLCRRPVLVLHPVV
jgi:nucleotide-binding universal stress UspA family protein